MRCGGRGCGRGWRGWWRGGGGRGWWRGVVEVEPLSYRPGATGGRARGQRDGARSGGACTGCWGRHHSDGPRLQCARATGDGHRATRASALPSRDCDVATSGRGPRAVPARQLHTTCTSGKRHWVWCGQWGEGQVGNMTAQGQRRVDINACRYASNTQWEVERRASQG